MQIIRFKILDKVSQNIVGRLEVQDTYPLALTALFLIESLIETPCHEISVYRTVVNKKELLLDLSPEDYTTDPTLEFRFEDKLAPTIQDFFDKDGNKLLVMPKNELYIAYDFGEGHLFQLILEDSFQGKKGNYPQFQPCLETP